MKIRNMSTIIVICSFCNKLEIDISKAQYVFTECVLCVYVWWSDQKRIAIGRTVTSGFGNGRKWKNDYSQASRSIRPQFFYYYYTEAERSDADE